MAELELKIKANYEEASKCREEMKKVEQQMMRLNENSAPQEIERLTKRYAELSAAWENHMSFIGKASVYIKEAYQGVGESLRDSVKEVGDLGSTTESIMDSANKRLQLENNILDVLKKQREEAEKQKNDVGTKHNSKVDEYNALQKSLSEKYDGQAEGFYSDEDKKALEDLRNDLKATMKEWDDVNVKVQVYDQLIEDSNERTQKLSHAVSEVENVYKGFAETAESTSTKIFISEEVFNRYRELSDRIDELKAKIIEVGEQDDIDLPELESLQKELGDAQEEFRSLDSAARSTAEVLGGNLASKVSDALTSLYAMNRQVRSAQEEYDKLESALKAANEELKKQEEAKNPEGIKQAREEVDRLTVSLDAASDKLSDFRMKQKDALSDVQNLNRQVSGGGNPSSGPNADAVVEAVTGKMKGLMGTIAGIAGIGVSLNQVFSIFDKAEYWRTYFQDIESSMKVFLGSAEKGAEFTQKLKDYAYYNMFEFSDLAAASQQMISYGHDVESIIPRLDQLSNVATGTHGSLMELVDTYNRAKATGVVDARGVQSWAVKGVMIRDVLREMGETAVGTSVTFDQLNKVLDKITGEGGQFHNLMGEMMENISAESGQLEDNLAAMYEEIGRKYQDVFVKIYKLKSDIADNYDVIGGGLIDFGAEAANWALDELAENWQKLVSVIKDAVVVIGSYRAALVLTTAWQKAYTIWEEAGIAAKKLNNIETEKEVAAKIAETASEAANTAAKKVNTAASAKQAATTGADTVATEVNTVAKGANTRTTVLMTKATKALSASMLANPVVLYAAAIAAIAYACYSAYDSMMTQEKAQKLLSNATEEHEEKMKEEEGKYRENIRVIKDTTASLNDQVRAYKNLVQAKGVFARYTREEIAKMSDEQINTLFNMDSQEQNEKRLKNQAEALKELQTIFNGKGAAWINKGEDKAIEDIIKKYELAQSFADQLKESIGKTTNLGEWADQMAQSTAQEYQDYLAESAANGIVEGFRTGFTNPELRASTAQMINDFTSEMSSKTSELEKELAKTITYRDNAKSTFEYTELDNKVKELTENLKKVRTETSESFRNALQPQVEEAKNRVAALNSELANASSDQKAQIQLKLDVANEDYQMLTNVMAYFGAGETNKELTITINSEVEDAELGDDKLIEIGKAYEEIDEKATKYTEKIVAAREEMLNMGDLSIEKAKEIAESHDLTAENIQREFGDTYDSITEKIGELENKLKETTDPAEKRKIKIEIDRQKELQTYLGNMQTRLNDIVKNPYQLRFNIVGKAQKWLMQVLKLAGFDVPDAEQKQQQQTSETNRQKGKDAAERQKANPAPETHTGAEWKSINNKAKQKRINELRELMKGQLTAADYEKYQKELDNLTKGNKNGHKEEENRKAKQIADELKYQEKLADVRRKAEEARRKAEIAEIKNSGEREHAERKFQHEKTLSDLQLQQTDILKEIYQQRKSDFDTKNSKSGLKYENTKEGTTGWLDPKAQAGMIASFSQKERDYYNARMSAVKSHTKEENEVWMRYLNDRAKQEAQNMRDYLKEYGSFEEKRLAIAQEYEQKIEEETDPYKRAALRLKRDEEQEKINSEELKQNINWDAIFQDVTNYDVQFLNTIQKQLEDAIKDGIEKGVDAADLKVFADKLQDVKDAIVSKSGGIFSAEGILGGSWMGNINSLQKKQEQLESRRDEKRDNAIWLNTKATQAESGKALAQIQYDNAVSMFGKDSEQAKAAQEDLTVASEEAQEAQKAAATAAGEAAAAEGAAASGAKAMSIAITDAIIHGVNQNLQSANNMVQEWGIGSEDFQEKFGKFAESSQYATQAFDSLKNGDIAGVVYNLGNAFNSLGESFGLWSNSNRAEIEKENQKLAVATQTNTEAINRLTEAMKKQNPEEAYRSYTRALEMMQANEQAAMLTMRNNASMYDGGHSLWSDFWDNGGGELTRQIYRALGKRYTDEGLSTMVSTFTAADWNKLLTERPDLMKQLGIAISNAEDEGNYNGMYQDILDFANRFSSDAYEQLRRTFQDAVTHISFDSMYSDFVSSLMNMDKKAEDFAQDFEGYMRNAIYQSMSVTIIKPLLEKWYDAFAFAMKSKENGKYLGDQELQDLMKNGGRWYDDDTDKYIEFMGYTQITQEALKIRDSIEQLGLYNGKNGYEQNASANAIKSISYDQAESLVGIGIALQMAQEQTRDRLDFLNTRFDEISPMIMESRDIAKDSRDILAGMAIHVEEIRDGVVDTLVPRIKNIDENLNKVYKIVEER